MDQRFWFGRPITPCRPSAVGPREWFVLGAYPSALHVRWSPPGYARPINAVAVDNEPWPFWTGTDEADLTEQFVQSGTWDDNWGTISRAGRFNGSSGAWLRDRVLCPLCVTFDQVWATDCLDTYRLSDGAAKRLRDMDLQRIMESLGIHRCTAQSHPSEAKIVHEALEKHVRRLRQELEEVKPKCIITLGNAALRVFRSVVEIGSEAPGKLQANPDYGRQFQVSIFGRSANWIPLAHPAAPAVHQRAHDRWIENMNG